MKSIVYGKHSLVLGGSGGIGAALSRRLAAAGSRVLIHGGHSKERLEALVSDLSAAGGSVEGLLLPIEHLRDIDPLFEGRDPFDIVICAFGPFVRGTLSALSARDWEEAYILNAALPGYLVSRSLAGMEERGFGRYLFFGGTNTDVVRGFRTTAAYSSAKSSLAVLVKSIALSSAHMGVAANVLCPGLVPTEYTDPGERAYLERLSGDLPLLDAQELADCAFSVLESPILNAAVIPADRGVSLGNKGSV